MQDNLATVLADPEFFKLLKIMSGSNPASKEIQEVAPLLQESILARLGSRISEGSISIGHLMWFLRHSTEDLDRLVGIKKHSPKKVSESKFQISENIGFIEVPSNFNQDEYLSCAFDLIREKIPGIFIEKGLMYSSFANPSTKMKSGEVYQVDMCVSCGVNHSAVSKRMEFLRSHKGVFLGVHGLVLVFEQLLENLHKGFNYFSYDDKTRLFVTEEGLHCIPEIRLTSNLPSITCGCIEAGGDRFDAFLLFQKIE